MQVCDAHQVPRLHTRRRDYLSDAIDAAPPLIAAFLCTEAKSITAWCRGAVLCCDLACCGLVHRAVLCVAALDELEAKEAGTRSAAAQAVGLRCDVLSAL